MGDLPAKDILDAVEGLGASNVRVFGSRARGDARSDSDLDLLASFPRGTTLFDIAGLELALEQLLGIKVDIFTEGSLRPSMKEQILAEARPLIAA